MVVGSYNTGSMVNKNEKIYLYMIMISQTWGTLKHPISLLRSVSLTFKVPKKMADSLLLLH